DDQQPTALCPTASEASPCPTPSEASPVPDGERSEPPARQASEANPLPDGERSEPPCPTGDRSERDLPPAARSEPPAIRHANPAVRHAGFDGRTVDGQARRMRWLSVCALSAAVLSASAVQDRRPERLAAEMDRVRADLANAPDDERTSPLQRLDRAKAALEANRPLLALYLTEAPWEAGKAWTFIKSADVTTAEAFEKKWTALGEPKPVPSGGSRPPAVIQPLAASPAARGPAADHRNPVEGAGPDGPCGPDRPGESPPR